MAALANAVCRAASALLLSAAQTVAGPISGLSTAATDVGAQCETTIFTDAEGNHHSCKDYQQFGYCAASSGSHAWMMSHCASTCGGCSEALRRPELLELPGRGRPFRTKPCGALGAAGEPSPVLDKLELAEAAPPHAWPRIACAVYSYHMYPQRLRDSFATWGQDCDAFLAFSDRTLRDEEADVETFEVHPDGYDEMAESCFHALMEVKRRVDVGSLDFDFLTFSDDDSFWIMSNLRHYLRTDPAVLEAARRGKGLLLGHRMALPWDHSTIFAHQGGMVIDKPALQAYARCELPFNETISSDPYIARCLLREGIPVMPTEDAAGAQRFHLFDDKVSLVINYTDFVFPSARYPEWLAAYHAPLLPLKGGLEGVSPQSVLFHYTSGPARLRLHDQLYRRHACPPPAPARGEL